MKKNRLIHLHIFYWLISFIGSVLIPYFILHADNSPLNVTFFITSFICFYVHYLFVVPNFFDPQKIFKSILGFLLSASCFVVVRYFVEEWFLPTYFGFRNYAEGTSFVYYFFDNVFFSSTIIFISTTFWFFNYSVDVENQKTELIESRKTAELQALKMQINPHFIFNSLNNIYSLVYHNSNKALPAIEELSRLLRYSTKDLEKDFILLEKEIGYIESLIALESLRIRTPELLIVEKEINYPDLNISPMLLVPFVENAFKHGNFSGKGFVLKVSDDNRILHFNLQNFKKNKMKDTNSGIGIENVRKRLEILYPKNHELNIKESESEFIVDLKINFSS